jgi:hypothetical protein
VRPFVLFWSWRRPSVEGLPIQLSNLYSGVGVTITVLEEN